LVTHRAQLCSLSIGETTYRYYTKPAGRPSAGRKHFHNYTAARLHLLKAHGLAEQEEDPDSPDSYRDDEGSLSRDDTDTVDRQDDHHKTVARKSGTLTAFVWLHGTKKEMDGCFYWGCDYCESLPLQLAIRFADGK
jgi:hypothetical protein